MVLRWLVQVLGLLFCAFACTLCQPAAAPRPSSIDRVAFAKASNGLGLELYAKLRAAEGNLVISPASISMALAMTWAGAREKTAEEIAKTLRLRGKRDEATASAGRLLLWLNDSIAEAPRLCIANRLFVQETSDLESDFLEVASEQFGAPVESVDFRGASEEARPTINTKVAALTEGRIPELLPPASVDAMSRMVLANAVFFLGDWLHPFSEQETTEREFNAYGELQNVPMMQQQASFGYTSADGAQILELPYHGEELSMLLVLPDQRHGLRKLEAELTIARIERWGSLLRPTKVRVVLPRLELGHSSKLRTPLQELGLKRAFEDVLADFSGISTLEDLFLEDVYHAVVVRVNEKGSGAPATAAPAAKSGAAEMVPEFIADHPFLFVIRVTRSGTILFLGRVVAPAA
jgi:serpin B